MDPRHVKKGICAVCFSASGLSVEKGPRVCNRLNQWVSSEQLQEYFDTVRAADYEERYNVSPADPVVYIAAAADGREVRIGEFGFLPTWSETGRVFNTRSEECFEKPMWREVILKQRCLVPAPGYFEYQETGGKRKQRWHVWPRSGELMGLAGVFNDRGEVSVLTIQPNAEQSAVKDRMPVILPREAWASYLDPANQHRETIAPWFQTAPDGSLNLAAVKDSQKSWPPNSPLWLEPMVPKAIPKQRGLFDDE
jgi:putative SOS response-associated peptidase YedK